MLQCGKVTCDIGEQRRMSREAVLPCAEFCRDTVPKKNGSYQGRGQPAKSSLPASPLTAPPALSEEREASWHGLA